MRGKLKGILVVLCTVFISFILIGCGGREVTYGGYTFQQVSTEEYDRNDLSQYKIIDGPDSVGETLYFIGNSTLKYKDKEYKYYISSYSKNNFNVEIEYPNGESATISSVDGITTTSRSFGSSTNEYPYPNIIEAAVVAIELSGGNGLDISAGNVLIAVIIFIIGLINILSPETGWYLSKGIYYKNAEPSDFALISYRITGVIICVISIMILMGVF